MKMLFVKVTWIRLVPCPVNDVELGVISHSTEAPAGVFDKLYSAIILVEEFGIIIVFSPDITMLDL